MYKCEICETIFDNPLIKDWKEDMDGEGHFEHFKQVVCPICFSPYFDELKKETKI